MTRFWTLISLLALAPALAAQTNSMAGNDQTVSTQTSWTLRPVANLGPRSADSMQHTIAGIGLVRPGAGWALVDGGLFSTSDDGRNWRQLKPSRTSQRIDGAF